MKTRFTGERTFGTLAVAFTAFAALTACDGRKATHPAPTPPLVYVMTVKKQNVPLFIEAVATLDGYVNADIRARVRGYLKKQAYKDGSTVAANELLFTIEPTEYLAALASADAMVARARAAQEHNKVQVERYEGLVKTGMVSEQELDNVRTSFRDADGQVQAANAARRGAALNLSYTQIRSPISGVAGIALVRVGNLVGQDGPTLLTTVSQIDPLRVTFPMAEADFIKYPYRKKRLDERDLAWAKEQFESLDAGRPAEGGDPGVELLLLDGSPYRHRGVVVSVNRQIDPSTGTIQLQALFPNPNGDLRPGQYGSVRIRRGDAGNDVIAIPERALISVQGTSSVGVVGPGNKVSLAPVELGAGARGLRIITSGLAEGDRIVTEGVQKIRDGTVVNPKPDTAGSTSVEQGSPRGAPSAGKP